MLDKKDINTMSTVFDVTPEEIIGAINGEQEVPLNLRVYGKLVSLEQEKELRENGVQQGKEIGYKEIAKSSGVELSAGEKDPEIIASKLKSSISSMFEEKYKNMTPTDELIQEKERVREWENKYNTLTQTYETATNEINEWQNKFNGMQKENLNKEFKNEILKSLPDKMKYDKEDALIIVSSLYDVREDKSIVDKRSGDVVLNSVGQPENITNIVKGLAEQKKWVKSSGMNGENRNGIGTGAPSGMSDEQALKYITDKGKSPMSPEGLALFNELTS